MSLGPLAALFLSADAASPAAIASARVAFALSPAQDVVMAFADRNGLSIVADGRLLEGRKIAVPRADAPPVAALQEALRPAGLVLQQIGERAFVVTAAKGPSAAAAPPPIANPVRPTAPPLLIDTIVVTAAAFGPADYSIAPGSFSIDEELLQLFNVNRTSDAIYELPQSLSSFTSANSSLAAAAAGLNLADLRGLGPERTLVLFDGKRIGSVAGGNGTVAGVDLNALPQPFIQRIEVNPFAQGARIGPEAVGGVINLVPKRLDDGIEAGARYGVSALSDAEETLLYAIGGAALPALDASITAGVSYAEDPGLTGRDRALTAGNFGLALDGRRSSAPGATLAPGFAGSVVGPRAILVGALDQAGDVRLVESAFQQVDGSGGLEPFVNRSDQLFNWSLNQTTLIPARRWTGFASARTERGDADFRLEGWVTRSSSQSQLSSVSGSFEVGTNPVTGDAVSVPLDNPFLTDEITDFAASEFGGQTDSLLFVRRFSEVGPRRGEIDRTYANIFADMDRRFGERAALQVQYRFGSSDVGATFFNTVDQTRLAQSLDVDLCAATPGCAPLDIINTDADNAAAGAFIRAAPNEERYLLREHEFRTAFTLFEPPLLGSSGRLTVDARYARQRLSFNVLAVGDPPALGSFIAPQTEAALNLGEVGLSLRTPLGARAGPVNLAADYRVTVGERYGAVHNANVSLDVTPTDGLTLYGSGQRGGRAPTLIELFQVGQGREEIIADPCDSGAPNRSPTVLTNCASSGPFGVDSDFQQTQLLAFSRTVGNPDLEPEENWSWNAGVSLTQDVFGGAAPGRFAVRAEWQETVVDNYVDILSDPITACYESDGLSSFGCAGNELAPGGFVQRDAETREISAHFRPLINQGRFRRRGLDLEARYTLALPASRPIDRLWASALHSYTDRVVREDEFGVQELTGSLDFPRHQTFLSVGVSRGALDFSSMLRRRGATLANPFVGSVPAVATFDLSYRHSFGERADLVATIENVSNRPPPLVLFGARALVAPQYYDLIGRRFSIGFRSAL
ncbi:MAG: TonB-dependent receptor [Pseudomonadota bacterium]